jgi:small basic protein (TIGR04137 family)
MSIDHSLKIEGALKRHRNVLTRAERVGQLKDEERWSEGQSVFGLPKIAHRKSHAGKKAKEEAAAEGAVAGVTPEAQAAGAKPAAAGAAPAKAAGAKPAASASPKEKSKEKPKEKGKQKTTGKT